MRECESPRAALSAASEHIRHRLMGGAGEDVAVGIAGRCLLSDPGHLLLCADGIIGIQLRNYQHPLFGRKQCRRDSPTS
jgi:hypothetical protein